MVAGAATSSGGKSGAEMGAGEALGVEKSVLCSGGAYVVLPPSGTVGAGISAIGGILPSTPESGSMTGCVINGRVFWAGAGMAFVCGSTGAEIALPVSSRVSWPARGCGDVSVVAFDPDETEGGI